MKPSCSEIFLLVSLHQAAGLKNGQESDFESQEDCLSEEASSQAGQDKDCAGRAGQKLRKESTYILEYPSDFDTGSPIKNLALS